MGPNDRRRTRPPSVRRKKNTTAFNARGRSQAKGATAGILRLQDDLACPTAHAYVTGTFWGISRQNYYCTTVSEANLLFSEAKLLFSVGVLADDDLQRVHIKSNHRR